MSLNAAMPAAADASSISNGMDRQELERALAAHERFLAGERNGVRAVLQSRNLARADLSNRDLAKIDLAGSSLNKARFKFTNLTQATLYCCELLGVDGRYATLERADMRGVTLNGSNLSHAKLDHADFRAGRLMRNGSTEVVVDRNALGRGVDFTYCSLNGATFQGADLRGADFSGAIIIGTKFKGARLGNARFKGAIIANVDLAELDLPPDALKDCLLPPSQQAMAAKERLIFQLNAHRSWVETDARLGTCGVFDGQDLRPLADVIGKFKLTAISARGAIAAGVDFSCTELQGANFEKADLRGASFEGADLRGAKFKGALLHHAKFLGADMRALRLKSGEMLPCDMSGAEFSDEQRSAAIFE